MIICAGRMTERIHSCWVLLGFLGEFSINHHVLLLERTRLTWKIEEIDFDCSALTQLGKSISQCREMLAVCHDEELSKNLHYSHEEIGGDLQLSSDTKYNIRSCWGQRLRGYMFFLFSTHFSLPIFLIGMHGKPLLALCTTGTIIM